MFSSWISHLTTLTHLFCVHYQSHMEKEKKEKKDPQSKEICSRAEQLVLKQREIDRVNAYKGPVCTSKHL